MDEIAAIIRLASKYQAENLRNHFVEIFVAAWPVTFDDWQTREKDMERILSEIELSAWAQAPDPMRCVNSHMPDPGRSPFVPIAGNNFLIGLPPVTAIQLGFDQEIRSILPSAFYVLNSLYRAEWEDRPIEGTSSSFDKMLPVSVDALDADMLRRFMRGREWMQVVFSRLMRTLLRQDAQRSVKCARLHDSRCSSSIEAWWDEKLGWVLSAENYPCRKPLTALKHLEKSVDGEKSLVAICEACRKNVKTVFAEAQIYIWQDLPVYFDTKNSAEEIKLTEWPDFR